MMANTVVNMRSLSKFTIFASVVMLLLCIGEFLRIEIVLNEQMTRVDKLEKPKTPTHGNKKSAHMEEKAYKKEIENMKSLVNAQASELNDLENKIIYFKNKNMKNGVFGAPGSPRKDKDEPQNNSDPCPPLKRKKRSTITDQNQVAELAELQSYLPKIIQALGALQLEKKIPGPRGPPGERGLPGPRGIQGPKHHCLPSTCAAITNKTKNGVYRIVKPRPLPTFDVYCDMVTSGGGWTVIQRRLDGSVDFYRGWDDYKRGFGNKNGEYWLGLDHIHAMTSQAKYRLRVDLEDYEGNTRYAEYDTFSVADEADKYRLSLGKYSGDANDALQNPQNSHNGMAFSTKDRDNDANPSGSCAVSSTGAWWYNYCHHSNLNGQYLRGNNQQYGKGVVWYDWKTHNYSLKGSEMKIKPTETCI